MEQVRIDYSQKWQAIHLRGIQSAYGKAPFFEFFFPYFQPILEKEEESLWNLNLQLLTICLKLLRWSGKITVSQEVLNSDDLVDIRGSIRPGASFLERNYYRPTPYPQLFGLDFEPNLSILDLLFCLGPEAGNNLKNSVKKE